MIISGGSRLETSGDRFRATVQDTVDFYYVLCLYITSVNFSKHMNKTGFSTSSSSETSGTSIS